MDLSSVSEQIQVETKTTLSKKLDKLSAVVSTSFSLQSYSVPPRESVIKVCGEDAGTIWEPNVELILSKSTPSSFGKGEKTVLDPEYRHGREIIAADINLGNFYENSIGEQVQAALFPGDSREIRLSLYKLAIYEKGGHFDWHRDTTHSDDHHATVLLALNTSWTGGDLKIRRDDVTITPKLHPRTAAGYNGRISCKSLGVVTFYTDIEHMVEPVTDGVRIILQFNVHVLGTENDEEKDEEDDDEERYESTIARGAGSHCSKPDASTIIPLSSSANDSIILEIIESIKELHADDVYEVGFPLQHLYRKASVLPAYLKCTDIQIYEALIRVFKVSLHPVLIRESSDWEGNWGADGITACKFDVPESDIKSEADSDSGDESDAEDRPKKKKARLHKIFYLPKMCPVVQISSQSYVEHTGNEAQAAEGKYFGAGFFVTAKEEESADKQKKEDE